MLHLVKYSILIITLFLYAITICTCSNDPIVIDPEIIGKYYLCCKISPGLEQQGAIIGKTVPEDIPIDVSGARVVISGEGQSVLLTELKPGFYVDMDNSLKVKPGGKYDINATLPDGETIQASAFVPDEFHIVTDIKNDTLDYILIYWDYPYIRPKIIIPPQISWTKSQHALSYLVSAGRSLGKSSVDNSVYLYERDVTDYFHKNPDSTSYVETVELVITAYDSSFLPYPNSYGYFHENYKDPYGENFRIEQVGKELNLKSGQNDNIANGIGYFSTSYTIRHSVAVRYTKKEGLTE